MRASLPRRLFSASLLALAIIILTPRVLRADMAEPMVLPWGLWIPALVAIIVIEGIVLRRRLGFTWGRAVKVAAVTNIVSTFPGILLALFWGDLYVQNEPEAGGVVLGLLILLVPLFIFSWWVEYGVAALMLKPVRTGPSVPPPELPAPPRRSLLRGIFDANVASYLFLAIMVLGFPGPSWVQDFRNPPPPWGRRGFHPAVYDVRSINTAEKAYADTYGGYSPSLAALAPGTGPNPTASEAGLVDSALATGVKYGYRFAYTPAPPDADGKIRSYTVTASPLDPKFLRWEEYYYTDQTGVIRGNATAPASAKDPPIAA